MKRWAHRAMSLWANWHMGMPITPRPYPQRAGRPMPNLKNSESCDILDFTNIVKKLV